MKARLVFQLSTFTFQLPELASPGTAAQAAAFDPVALDHLDPGATRALVEEYGKVLVPAREATVALTQERYDAMLGGVYELVLARQSELGTYVEYIESLRDYWIARSDLERAVGTRLSPATATP